MFGIEQYSKPTGEEGKACIKSMYDDHRDPMIWMLENMPECKPENVLDIGCGGGMCIHMMLEKYPSSKGYGIDISEECIEASNEYNKSDVAAGRASFSVGEVSHLPFEDGKFDIVTATSTYFFWPDLENDLKEISSKMKSGGILVITSGSSADQEVPEHMKKDMENMKLVTDKRMMELYDQAGLDGKVMRPVSGMHWVMYLGIKR